MQPRTETIPARRHQPWLYLGLALLFFGCLWVGWRDFDPYIPQDVVREGIRSGIRGIIQLLVQFIVPVAILVYFASKFLSRRRSVEK